MDSHERSGLRLWREVLLVAPDLGQYCRAVIQAQREAFRAHFDGITGEPVDHPAVIAYTEALSECNAHMIANLDADGWFLRRRS